MVFYYYITVNIMVYLGIDYGLKRVGLALAEGTLASPLEVLKNDNKLCEKVAKRCSQLGVEKVVIGLPEGKIALKVRNFAHQLERQLALPIDFEPETLTTQEAIAKMIESGKSRKSRQQDKDSWAAALILQNYLE
ncbi:Holliday junction resolvase RuvX [Patescibacteria group bacterium]